MVPCCQRKKQNWDEVNKLLHAELLTLRAKHSDLESRQAIDYRVTLVTSIIQKLISNTIPNANPSRYAKTYWTYQCSEAVKNARRARREWKKIGTEESCIEYQKSTSKEKAQIKRAKTIRWRLAVVEATKDPGKIRKLAKWAEKDP